jgi:hypothetical protein
MSDVKIVQVFESPIIMHLFIKDYLQQYAPAGYNTKVNVELLQNYEQWRLNQLFYKVTITRWESCD